MRWSSLASLSESGSDARSWAGAHDWRRSKDRYFDCGCLRGRRVCFLRRFVQRRWTRAPAIRTGAGDRRALRLSRVGWSFCRLVHWRPADWPRFLAPALGADALEDAESVNQPVNQQGGTLALKR